MMEVTMKQDDLKQDNLPMAKEEIMKNYETLYEVNATIEPDGEDKEIKKTFYFIKPEKPSFSRYMKKVTTDNYEAAVIFVKDNIIIEQKDDLNKTIEEYPAMVMNLVEKLLAMLGFAKSANFKKL